MAVETIPVSSGAVRMRNTAELRSEQPPPIQSTDVAFDDVGNHALKFETPEPTSETKCCHLVLRAALPLCNEI
jgi:hypothetical protein